jgi:UDP-GlcNAc:undecaprenyl-phosphate GlcNAc-1-phosphate transferase
MILYVLLLFISIFIAIVINRLLLAFAKNLGTRGKELIQVRWASTSKPSLGGISFYITFIGIISLIGIVGNNYSLISQKQMLGIFICVSLGFSIGFADDTYNTNPLMKFIGQLCCGCLLYFFKIQILLFPGYEVINMLFTVFWVVAIMNSINMLDNMDGIVSSISIVIVISFILALLLLNIQDRNLIYIFVVAIGSLLGFLYHNWFPSKMYMGDAGSQFLGAFLAVFAIIILWNNKTLLYIQPIKYFEFNIFLIPILIFCIPIIDTITVSYKRILRKQSPFVGGNDHTTHHLVYYGMNERQVAYILVFFNIVSTLLGLAFIIGYFQWTSLNVVLVCSYLLIIFIIMQYLYSIGSKRKGEAKNKKVANKPMERVSLVNRLLS